MDKLTFHCPGCMEELEIGIKKCPLCGFSIEEYEKEGNKRALRPGTILGGRYEMGRELGGGGFGITYLAWDREDKCKVAVKEYFPWEFAYRNIENDGEIQIRGKEEQEGYEKGLRDFIREGTILEQVGRMKGIVPVRKFFREKKTAYLVMDYISGMNLKEYMEKEGRIFREAELLEKIKPLLISLNLIHQKGMIHRDISPDNIIMDDNRELTLIDFGAARLIAEEQDRSTTVLMKYGYAPEEQYRSRGKLGPWSDIYAISATMYYLLTGVRPIQSIDRLAEDDMLPLSQMGIRISERTSRVIEKGMAVQAEDRYEDLDSFLEELYGNGVITKQINETCEGKKEPEEKKEQERKKGGRLEKWILFLTFVTGAILLSFVFLIASGKIDLSMVLNSTGQEDQDNVFLSEETVKVEDGRLFVLLRENTSEYSASEEKFIRAAAKASGFSQVTCRFYQEDEVSQNQCVREAVTDGYDAIICDPGYRAFYVALFNQALEKGIPVFIVNHSTDDLDSITMSIGADTKEGMKMAAQKLKELLDGKGTYAAILGNENIDSVTQSREAIEEVLENEDMEIAAISTVERGNKAAEEEMARILEENPDLNGVLCNSNALGTGAARAVKKAGLEDQIHIVTIGGSNRLKDFVKAGLVDAVVVRPLDDMLTCAVNQAARLIKEPDAVYQKEQKVPCILLNEDEIDRMDNYSVAED